VSVEIDIIEQMFEYSVMPPALTLPSAPPERAALVALQQRIRSMETTSVAERVFPVSAVFSELFPEGGLRKGVVYQCDSSASVLWTLLAEATTQGVWCALVGLPDMGVAAAEDMGVNLDRLVLVPHPGNQWLSVVGALSDVVGIVVMGPQPAPSQRMMETLLGRLRDREATLVVNSAWPRTEANISVTSHQWEGLGSGHGTLQRHRISVTLKTRNNRSPRHCELLVDAWGAHAQERSSVVDISHYRHAG
jgi:hypothetical protein